MRTERHFAFVDLSGFTAFTDAQGDDRAVDVLMAFRRTVRTIGTEHAVRVAKWLGDGCMLVSVESGRLVAAVLDLATRWRREGLALGLHVGMAGGDVILLEGDDYTGRAVNLASRLASAARAGEILATPELAAVAPRDCAEPAGSIEVKGFNMPVEAWRIRSNELGAVAS